MVLETTTITKAENDGTAMCEDGDIRIEVSGLSSNERKENFQGRVGFSILDVFNVDKRIGSDV